MIRSCARTINNYGAIVGTATLTTTAGATSHGVMLIPFRAVTDLNGDGNVDDQDGALQAGALSSTASPEDDAKKDGTEYLFPSDTISHGIWNIRDTSAVDGSGHPLGTVDDNAKQIKITCGATFGSVWFDYTTTTGTGTPTFAFYKTGACNSGDKITFPTTTLNGTTTTLYVREEGAVSAEITGTLVMKLGTADKTQTFCQTPIPLDIVTTLGDAHFFQAANRYILQNNCLHYFGIKNYTAASDTIDIVVRREDNSTMQAVDAYWRTPKLLGVSGVAGAYPTVDQIINGNLCGDREIISAIPPALMTSTCIGRLISGGVLNTNVSTFALRGPAGSDGRYIAMGAPHQFTLAGGAVPASGYQEALGGLSSTTGFNAGFYVLTMIGEAPADTKHRVLFTLSYTTSSNGVSSSNMVSDAANSGCPPLPGGLPGELTLFWNDGSTSIALALKDPSSTLQVLVNGYKNSGIPYYINTYLIFDSTKPRP